MFDHTLSTAEETSNPVHLDVGVFRHEIKIACEKRLFLVGRKIFITGDICPFGLASLTDEP